jgi:hypothetical protein
MAKKSKERQELVIKMPRELMQRMRKHGTAENWNAVALAAFERKLDGAETFPQLISGVVERLRAEKEKGKPARKSLPATTGNPQEREMLQGREFGRRWAEVRADWNWFQQLEAVRAALASNFLGDKFSPAGLLQLRPVLHDLFLHFRPANDWHGQVWLCSRHDSDPHLYPNPYASPLFVHGFLLGALELWDAVKDRL